MMTPKPPSGAVRCERLDALRGVAIVWMVAFHFCFDLQYFRLIDQNFYADPRWTLQRTCIVSLFLFCGGMGQSLAWALGRGWTRFWRRWAQVVFCAALVTVASLVMFPRSYISFGVLHGMAVMLLVTRLTAPAGAWLWLLGAVAIALPQVVAHPFFDSPAAQWIGLVTRKPVTEDFVPVLPWLGVMWWGMAAGQCLWTRRPHWMAGRLLAPTFTAPLAWLGRRPLSAYMLHQPLLMAGIASFVWVFGR